MEQRVRARLPDVRVVLQVKVGAEIRGRVATLFPAKAHIMPQRVLTGPAHVIVATNKKRDQTPRYQQLSSFNPVFWVYQHVFGFSLPEIYLYAPILLQALRAALRIEPQHAAPEDAKIAQRMSCYNYAVEINYQVAPPRAKKSHKKG